MKNSVARFYFWGWQYNEIRMFRQFSMGAVAMAIMQAGMCRCCSDEYRANANSRTGY